MFKRSISKKNLTSKRIMQAFGMTRLCILLFCSYAFGTSCNLRENFARNEKINSDMISTFNNENITTSVGWGTQPKDNYVTVLFYSFDVDIHSYAELDSLSLKARELILKYNSNRQDPPNIEIKFTKEGNPEKAEKFITFTYKNTSE